MNLVNWQPIETAPADTGEIFWVWSKEWVDLSDPDDEAGSSVRDGFLENGNWHVLTWEGTRLCAGFKSGTLPTHWARKVNPETVTEGDQDNQDADRIMDKLEEVVKAVLPRDPVRGSSDDVRDVGMNPEEDT